MRKPALFLLFIIALIGFVVLAKTPGLFFLAFPGRILEKSILFPFTQNTCNKNLWKHVYSPKRLTIIENCISVTGTISRVEQEKDGDLHVLLRVDEKYSNLPNESNKLLMKGDLVVEIICYGKVEEEAAEACRGYKNTIKMPISGSHVAITGSLVKDETYGWIEIHPVSSMKIIN